MVTVLFLVWFSGALLNTWAIVRATRKDEQLKDVQSSMVICGLVIGLVMSWLVPLYFICEIVYNRLFRKGGRS